MRIFLTGGTGFIGYHLTEKLVNLGHEVIITGSPCENIPNCKEILSRNGWKHLSGKIDVCFHLAANNNTLCTDSSFLYTENVIKSRNMLDQLYYENKCENFVIASSCAVYGKRNDILKENDTPASVNAYGQSKLYSELMFPYKKDNPKMVFLRYSNVYGNFEEHKGERASVVNKLINNYLKNETPRLFKYGEQKRDWVYVNDVVDANILAMNIPGGIYNCGSGEARSFNEIIGIINSFNKGKIITPKYIKNNNPESYQSFTQTDITKLKEWGYIPKYSLEQGIEDILKQKAANYAA